MRGFFVVSYVVLWMVVVLESLLLREVLRGTVKFKRLREELSSRKRWSPASMTAPDFTVPILQTGKSLTTSDLKDQLSMLVFISAAHTSPFYASLNFALRGMWNKVQGHIYLVCHGNEASCGQIAKDYALFEHTKDEVPILLDEDGKITAAFGITSTPQAVELDKDLRVRRRGQPVQDEPIPESNGNGTPRLNTPEVAIPTKAEDDCNYPDSDPMSGASFARMDTKVSCLITRFQLRSVWFLIPFYLAFRRVRRSSMDVSGLLKAVFLIEDMHTCYTMSLWKNDCAIVDFGRVQAHVKAANSAFNPTWRKDKGRAEIWSAQFRLWAVSAHNLNWEGLDLETVIKDDQWSLRERVAKGEFLGEEVTHA